MLTSREARYVALRIQGKSVRAAMKAIGFNDVHAERIETDEVKAALVKYQQELTDHAILNSLINAKEIHEYLTDALRARISDIQNDDGSFKPISEWPDIWQRMYEGGDVEVETLSDRSNDGETKDKRGGWDRVGTVTSVKFKFASRQRLLELAMKHKAVNAMAPINQQVDINITVSAEEQRRLAAAEKRMRRVGSGKTAEISDSNNESQLPRDEK